MSFSARYAGSFVGVDGVFWRVVILQDPVKAPYEHSADDDLTFDADSPITIEWPETSKEVPLQGSTATLRIVSPSDRKYIDLYTVDPTAVMVAIFRNEVLYWRGLLDAEFYEEPYESLRGYTVELTFSDFGVLERLKYDLSDFQSAYDIISAALSRAGFTSHTISHNVLTSLYDGNTPLHITDVAVASSNFCDEDGEWSTWKDAISGILQPLAMRLIQRNGVFYVYDLNGLYNNGRVKGIEWSADHQTLSTDKVYNSVRVTFSPYQTTANILPEIEVDTTTTEATYTIYPDMGLRENNLDNHHSPDYSYIDFRLKLCRDCKGLEVNPDRGKPFKIESVGYGSASDCEGVAFGIVPTLATLKSGNTTALIHAGEVNAGEDVPLFKSERIYLPGLTQMEGYLRLSLDLLFDPRYNPFSSIDKDSKYNEKDNYKNFNDDLQFAFAPIAINLYESAEGGTPICHWQNRYAAEKAVWGSIYGSSGIWDVGPASFGDAWLQWYDQNDMKKGCAVLGWKTNRSCIGRPDVDSRRWPDAGGLDQRGMYESFRKDPDGQYIKLPPFAGYIEVTVYAGVGVYKWNVNTATGQVWQSWPYEKCRWWLYKGLKLEVVTATNGYKTAEAEDIEYTGWLNKAAKNELSIDTICGTIDTRKPTGRGSLYRTSPTREIVGELTRAGHTDCPERLLIGTIYSQYAQRHCVLSGEDYITDGGVCVFTERNQPGKKFMITGESQDLRLGVTDATYIELSPDEYSTIEEIED